MTKTELRKAAFLEFARDHVSGPIAAGPVLYKERPHLKGRTISLESLAAKYARPYRVTDGAHDSDPAACETITEATREMECIDPTCSGRPENGDRGASVWLGARHFHQEPIAGHVRCPQCRGIIPLSAWWDHGCPKAIVQRTEEEPARMAA